MDFGVDLVSVELGIRMDVVSGGVVWCTQERPIGPSIQVDTLTIYITDKQGRMACFTIQAPFRYVRGV